MSRRRAALDAVGYVRVSTEDQVTEGVSLDAQRSAIRAWSSSRGYRLAAIHADEGMSGKRADNRPGLQAALVDVCKRKGVLVAYDLTRLARSTQDAIEISQRVQKCGAQLALTTGDIDTTTPHGEFQFTLIAAFGQLERRIIGVRTRDALAHKRSEGKRYCNVAPYGYRWKDGRLVEAPAERAALKRMQRLRAGGMGHKRIAQDLNKRGVRNRSGREWMWTSVKSALENRMRAHEAAIR